jgi:CRISPR-associated protein Csd1
MQYVAQGDVGADVVSRFYGNASTYPHNVFPRLLRLEKHHRAKATKSDDRKRRNAAAAIGRKIDDVNALFPPGGPFGFPDFPRQLSQAQQGRFALGFHQQKAADQREKDAAYAAKLAAVQTGAETNVDADGPAPDA